MYDQVVKCQRAGLCLSEHFLIYIFPTVCSLSDAATLKEMFKRNTKKQFSHIKSFDVFLEPNWEMIENSHLQR